MKPFKKIYHIACDLERSKNPDERLLAVVLHKASHALHDVQSGESPRAATIDALKALDVMEPVKNLLDVV